MKHDGNQQQSGQPRQNGALTLEQLADKTDAEFEFQKQFELINNVADEFISSVSYAFGKDQVFDYDGNGTLSTLESLPQPNGLHVQGPQVPATTPSIADGEEIYQRILKRDEGLKDYMYQTEQFLKVLDNRLLTFPEKARTLSHFDTFLRQNGTTRGETASYAPIVPVREPTILRGSPSETDKYIRLRPQSSLSSNSSESSTSSTQKKLQRPPSTLRHLKRDCKSLTGFRIFPSGKVEDRSHAGSTVPGTSISRIPLSGTPATRTDILQKPGITLGSKTSKLMAYTPGMTKFDKHVVKVHGKKKPAKQTQAEKLPQPDPVILPVNDESSRSGSIVEPSVPAEGGFSGSTDTACVPELNVMNGAFARESNNDFISDQGAVWENLLNDLFPDLSV